MCENIDIGFVSLTNKYYGACIPSKIYEYINLGLPMIGALPLGDGKDMINNMEYGIAVNFESIDKISQAIKKFEDKAYLDDKKNNIIKDKMKWNMKNTILEINKLLKKL